MLNFDPATMGVYLPPDHYLLHDAVVAILDNNASAKLQAMEDLLNSDLIDFDSHEVMSEECDRQELEIDTKAYLSRFESIDFAYRFLRNHLLSGDVTAKAVDSRCNVYEIDAYFWSTPFAHTVFETGILDETPHFRPHGRFILSYEDITLLSKYAYNQAYRSLLPLSPGKIDNMQNFQHLYANSLMSEAEEIRNKKVGAIAQIDKEPFLIEVFALIHRDHLFKSKSELARLATDEYVARNPENRRPSVRWAEEVVAKVWDRLDLKDMPVSELRRIRDGAG